VELPCSWLGLRRASSESCAAEFISKSSACIAMSRSWFTCVSEPTDPVTVAPRVRHKGRRPGNVRPCGGVVQVLVAVLSWRSNSVSIAEWLIDDGYPASFLDHCQKGFSRAVMLFGSERVRVSVHVSEFVQAFHCSN
jgi:hypothetical protein